MANDIGFFSAPRHATVHALLWVQMTSWRQPVNQWTIQQSLATRGQWKLPVAVSPSSVSQLHLISIDRLI